MWTPYFLFDNFVFDDLETGDRLSKSFGSEEYRLFRIWFLLDDIRLRRKEIQIQAQVEDNAVLVLSEKESEKEFRLYCGNGKSGKIEVIVCEVVEDSPLEAFWYCFNRLSHLLSCWTLMNGGSQAIYGFHVLDTLFDARFQCLPDNLVDHVKPVPVFIPPALELFPEHRNMLSLYREARNSTSPFYGMLCSFKIMEAVLEHQLFSDTDKSLLPLPHDHKRKPGVITQKMLEAARVDKKYQKYDTMKFKKFMEDVRPVRNRIAHGVTDQGEMYDFDDVDNYIEVTTLASLADLVAREILVEEFRLRYIIDNGGDSSNNPFAEESAFIYLAFSIHPESEMQTRWLDRKP